METIIRRCRGFVNIVAENYDKSGLYYSVHRLDVSKHLFYPSTIHAHCNNTSGGGVIEERLQELPAPCIRIQTAPTTVAASPKMAFCGLVSPSISESRILCINEAGHSLLYDADERMSYAMRGPEGLKGPVSVSLSIAQAGTTEEGMCTMHGVDDGQELKFLFDVLSDSAPRAGALIRGGIGSLFHRRRSSAGQEASSAPTRTTLEGGRTICLSSAAEGVGTYFFETVRGEWSRAGMPGEWIATKMDLLNLGSDRFAIAKVCKVIRNIGESAIKAEDAEDEFLVLTGVEIRPDLQTFQHKSIRYMCTNYRIHHVL